MTTYNAQDEFPKPNAHMERPIRNIPPTQTWEMTPLNSFPWCFLFDSFRPQALLCIYARSRSSCRSFPDNKSVSLPVCTFARS